MKGVNSLHCEDINNSSELLELHDDDLDFELGPAPYYYLWLKYPGLKIKISWIKIYSYHSVKGTGKPLIINPVHTGSQAFHDGDGIGQVWSWRITAHGVLLERTKLDRVRIGYFSIFLIERAALEFLTGIRPFMTCLFQCSASKLYTFSFLRTGQDWLQGATAHGVRLASIKRGWVWLARSTAPSALLGSTRLDQVHQICLIYCSQSMWLNWWSLLWSYHV